MTSRNYAAPQGPLVVDDNPLRFAKMVGGHPNIDFYWKEKNGKRRLIGNPNKPMRELHELFGVYIRSSIETMGDGNYPLIKLPSSLAFVKGSNPLKNAAKHRDGKFFYITDIHNAYPSVDLVRLAALIVYIKKYAIYGVDFSLSRLGQNASLVYELREDELFTYVHAFLESFCAGVKGEGLAVGGPLSPYLFNLYCEVYVDANVRLACRKYNITYTRFADDCVFTRNKPIIGNMRREIRECIRQGGFNINHWKSHVLSREMGTVFVTKIGLHEPLDSAGEWEPATFVFPQKKRRRLHGIIGSYLKMQMDWPEKVSGFIAEFLHYFKNVKEQTATDRKTLTLCKKFEAEWEKHR